MKWRKMETAPLGERILTLMNMELSKVLGTVNPVQDITGERWNGILTAGCLYLLRSLKNEYPY